jgi:hypothetical protein
VERILGAGLRPDMVDLAAALGIKKGAGLAQAPGLESLIIAA